MVQISIISFIVGLFLIILPLAVAIAKFHVFKHNQGKFILLFVVGLMLIILSENTGTI